MLLSTSLPHNELWKQAESPICLRLTHRGYGILVINGNCETPAIEQQQVRTWSGQAVSKQNNLVRLI